MIFIGSRLLINLIKMNKFFNYDNYIYIIVYYNYYIVF